MPTALTTLYVSQSDMEDLLSTEGVELRLDDNGDGSVSAAELLRLTTNARNYATAKVNRYLSGRYAEADLATSWVINEWAAYLACNWLSRRRGNPGLFKAEVGEAIKDMKEIRAGVSNLEDIPARHPSWPTWSNTRVDSNYRLRKIRVERPISEEEPTSGKPQQRDIWADVIFEPN